MKISTKGERYATWLCGQFLHNIAQMEPQNFWNIGRRQQSMLHEKSFCCTPCEHRESGLNDVVSYVQAKRPSLHTDHQQEVAVAPAQHWRMMIPRQPGASSWPHYGSSHPISLGIAAQCVLPTPLISTIVPTYKQTTHMMLPILCDFRVCNTDWDETCNFLKWHKSSYEVEN